MEKAKFFFFGLSFALFELWIYCVFTPLAELPVLVQGFSNQYWFLVGMSLICSSAGIIIGIYSNPVEEKISQLESQINNDGKFFIFIAGLAQVIIGMVIVLINIITYPSKEVFFLWVILGILVSINGIKYCSASFRYRPQQNL